MTDQDLLSASAVVTEEFVLETLTSFFMHGSRKCVEVRIPSIKGVLRYWWRTLQDLPSEAPSKKEKSNQPTKTLFEEESSRFGSIRGDQGRRSPVILRLKYPVTDTVNAPILPHRFEKKGVSTAIRPNQTIHLIMLLLKKDAESRRKEGLTLKEEHSLYMRWMLLLSGFGQRARRGAGAVQYEGFQWQSVTDIQKTLREILEKLKRDDIFEFPPPEEGLLLRRKEKPKNKHPQINAVWVGRSYTDAEEVRRIISKAGHVANSQGGLLGSSKSRFASPLHCTVRRVGQDYVPIITEVTSRDMHKTEYHKARNRFLQELGVNT